MTGNILNVEIIPGFISQGVGKSAGAHMMWAAADAYKSKASDVCDGQGIPEVCFQLISHLSGCRSLIIWQGSLWILECE
jgi:hypothetical protein